MPKETPTPGQSKIRGTRRNGASTKGTADGLSQDRANYRLEKNIPLPRASVGGKGNQKYPWNEMELNDSFFVPGGDLRSFYSQTYAARKRYQKHFVARKWTNEDGVEGVRVWRIAYTKD